MHFAGYVRSQSYPRINSGGIEFQFDEQVKAVGVNGEANSALRGFTLLGNRKSARCA